MNTLASKNLAEIVTNDHRTAAIFEKYQLDFCCKGTRSLQQACKEKDIPVEEIASQLAEIMKVPAVNNDNFEQYGLSQLITYIVQTHHEYVKKESAQIQVYLQKIAAKHGGRHPEMIKVFELFEAIKEELELHLKKEELILFPRINEMEKLLSLGKPVAIRVTYLQSPITILQHEHNDAGNMMEEIRELTGNYTLPPDACTTYRLSFAALQAFEADLHRHVHLENNLLFPKALKLFSTASTGVLN